MRVAGLVVRKYLADKVDGLLHFQHFVGLVALDYQSRADNLSCGSNV
jgi:hypothetical protein